MSDYADTGGAHLVKLHGIKMAGCALWVECRVPNGPLDKSVQSQAGTVRHALKYLIRREVYPFEEKVVSHMEADHE